jgi:hypothetical protein
VFWCVWVCSWGKSVNYAILAENYIFANFRCNIFDLRVMPSGLSKTPSRPPGRGNFGSPRFLSIYLFLLVGIVNTRLM